MLPPAYLITLSAGGAGGGSVTVPCLTLVTPWTVARQAPLSMGFSRQEYWNRLPFPSAGDLSDPGDEPVSPALAGGFFTTEPPVWSLRKGQTSAVP